MSDEIKTLIARLDDLYYRLDKPIRTGENPQYDYQTFQNEVYLNWREISKVIRAQQAVAPPSEQDQRVIAAAERLRRRANNLVNSSEHYREAVETTWKTQNPDDCDWLVNEEVIDEDEAISRQSDAYSSLTSDEYYCAEALAEFDKAKEVAP